MEKNRNCLIVILAGYSDDIENLLSTNPGLKERIAFNIHFPDYSTDELLEIFLSMNKKEPWVLSKEVKKKLCEVFEGLPRGRDFGNGRKIRNIHENMVRSLKNRVVTNNAAYEFNIEDIQAP